jgi:hypothetical protein
MALLDICAYNDQASFGAGPCGENVILTGHHIIPDHCFYYTSGLRGKGDLSGFLCPGVKGYTTADAPVIMVTANPNGGKSLMHGNVHAIFDAIEQQAEANGNQWAYAEARAAASFSVAQACGLAQGTIAAILDAYFKTKLGVTDGTMLRAGEHGTMKDAPEPRRSSRNV